MGSISSMGLLDAFTKAGEGIDLQSLFCMGADCSTYKGLPRSCVASGDNHMYVKGLGNCGGDHAYSADIGIVTKGNNEANKAECVHKLKRQNGSGTGLLRNSGFGDSSKQSHRRLLIDLSHAIENNLGL